MQLDYFVHKKMSIMQDKKLLDWKNKMEHVVMYLVVAVVVVVLVVGIGQLVLLLKLLLLLGHCKIGISCWLSQSSRIRL